MSNNNAQTFDKIGKTGCPMNILVNGYVRNASRECNVPIVDDITNIIFMYWFVDQWDVSWLDPVISLNNQTITMTKQKLTSLYGVKNIGTGSFEWKIRFNTKMCWYYIGIVIDDEKALKQNGGLWDEGNGVLLDAAGILFHSISRYEEYYSRDGFYGKYTIVAMKLNMDKRTISYTFNGKYGKAIPIKLLGNKCRLHVMLLNKGSSITLL